MRADHHQPHGGPEPHITSDSVRLPFNWMEVAPQHTLGRSGRVWSMPYPIVASETMNPSSPLLQIKPEISTTIENTFNFLKLNAPETLAQFARSLWSSLSRSNKTLLQAILDHGATQPPPFSRATVAPHPLLRTVEVPSIGEEHWAYRNHYELGHYKSVTDNFQEDCAREASSDISSILTYIRAYKALAENYTGPNLEAATAFALFRDPYYTCMALCVCEMQLPSHFLALIHHGIGLQFVLMSRVTTSYLKPSTPTRGLEEQSIAEAFQILTSLYLEDFVE
jgi:hypothetical protein